MKVCVVGAGYVGLVTGAGLAALGHDVICVDTDPSKVEGIKNRKAPFFEPGLDSLLEQTVASGKLDASIDLGSSFAGADVSIIAVGTPSNEIGIDLTYVREAATAIGRLLPAQSKFHVVVVKSTVVPTTTDTIVRQELELASGLIASRDFGLAANPEFLREGCAVEDFTNPDRIVIGALDDRSRQILAAMYFKCECPIVHTTPRNAEMVKYAANAVLATLISFSNEIAGLCETVPGLDENIVMSGVHLDRRWWVEAADGTRIHPAILTYLRAGVGFGGSCFPKDIRAICSFAAERGVPLRMLSSVLSVNEERARRIVDLLGKELGDLKGKRVAVFGLAFKPNTDDVRESPGVEIGKQLLIAGASVVTHDPMVSHQAAVRSLGGSVDYESDAQAAATGADAVVIATAWDQYRRLDWVAIAVKLKQAVVLDGRQVVSSEQLPRKFKLLRVGRGEYGGLACPEAPKTL